MPNLICIGAVADAFGVRGEVKVKSFTDDPKDVFAYGPLRNVDEEIILTVTGYRAVKGGFAARCEQVKTREQAEALKSTKLYVRREDMPDADDDEFYYEDLIGLAAELEDGTVMGRVKAVHEFGAGDVLEITGGKNAQGKKSPAFHHPFTKTAVPVVDVKGGKLVIVIEEPEVVTPDFSG